MTQGLGDTGRQDHLEVSVFHVRLENSAGELSQMPKEEARLKSEHLLRGDGMPCPCLSQVCLAPQEKAFLGNGVRSHYAFTGLCFLSLSGEQEQRGRRGGGAALTKG